MYLVDHYNIHSRHVFSAVNISQDTFKSRFVKSCLPQYCSGWRVITAEKTEPEEGR
jgi:hypothetical protein